MKIKYEFVKGETVEIETSDEWGKIILELDREEYNVNQCETRRHCGYTEKHEYESFDYDKIEDQVVVRAYKIGGKVFVEGDARIRNAKKSLTKKQLDAVENVYCQRRS